MEKKKCITFGVNCDLYRRFTASVKIQGKDCSEVLCDEISRCISEGKVFTEVSNDKDCLKAVHVPEELWKKYSIFLKEMGCSKGSQLNEMIRDYVRRREVNVVSGQNATYERR